MQASNGFAPPAHHLGVPHAAELPPDHDLKRQYLALLPPPQIIDICLTFDLHVPLYIKSSVWPSDLNSAIGAMKGTTTNSQPQQLQQPPQSEKNSSDGDINHETLDAPPLTQKHSDASASTTVSALPVASELDLNKKQTVDEPLTPVSTTTATATAEPVQPTPATLPPSASAPAITVPLPVQTPSPATISVPAPGYAHPGYPYPPPTNAYPHHPYYTVPPGYSPYPHGGYPQYPGTYHPPHPANPIYPGVHPAPGPHPGEQYGSNPNSDDLPSYEEMIVEALQDSGDPEGCAPKDLFASMASRYPLQSNFRPSASQALQKAFKRGRLEKSSGGKYRLSATWEGGNTSRRTTRRPQTSNQSQNHTSSHPSASPFTHTPLVHHHQPPPGPPFQPSGFGYPYSIPPAYSGYAPSSGAQPTPQPPPPPNQAANAQPPTTPLQIQQPPANQSATQPGENAIPTSEAPPPPDPASVDVYEAAQNLLKAINFGGLFQLAEVQESATNLTNGSATMESTSANTSASRHETNQPQNPPQHHPHPHPPLSVGPLGPIMGVFRHPHVHATLALPPPMDPVLERTRLELQAHFNLLAIQLAEMVQLGEEQQSSPPQLSPSQDVVPLAIHHVQFPMEFLPMPQFQLPPHSQSQSIPYVISQAQPIAPVQAPAMLPQDSSPSPTFDALFPIADASISTNPPAANPVQHQPLDPTATLEAAKAVPGQMTATTDGDGDLDTEPERDSADSEELMMGDSSDEDDDDMEEVV